MQNYENLDVTLKGPWSGPEIADFMDAAIIPVRLSVIHPQNYPVVASLWFIREGSDILCACRQSSEIAKLVNQNPVCGFEIAGDTPPYFGIRGQGKASIDKGRGEPVLRRLVDRYVDIGKPEFRRWLLKGASSEVAIIIKPDRIMSWDYRARMSR